MKKNAFTLVELLAVIIILGIIGTLIVPNIVRIIDNADRKGFLEASKSIIRSAEGYFAENDFDISEGTCFPVIGSHIELKEGSNITGGEFCLIDEEPFLKHVTNGTMCLSGKSDNLETYPCGEKKVVFFKGNLLGSGIVPYKSVPSKAIVVKKDTKIGEYIKEYERTYNFTTPIVTYNFWEYMDIPSIPTSYNPELTSNSIITNDSIFEVATKNALDSTNYMINVVEGQYKIEFRDNNSFGFGLNATNVISSSNKSIYILKMLGGGLISLRNISNNLMIDITGGSTSTANIINYESNETSAQKFKIVEVSPSVYKLVNQGNDAVCFKTSNNTFREGQQVVQDTCNGSATEFLRFKKA